MSQCHKGSVNDLYETGRALVDLGAVLGQDMTVECCYAKLAYLLGKGYSIDKIRKMMMTSLKGELTDIRKTEETFSLKSSNMIKAIAKVLNSEEADDYKAIK